MTHDIANDPPARPLTPATLPPALVRGGGLFGLLLLLIMLYAMLSPQPPGPPMDGHADKVAHFIGFATLITVFSAVGTLPLRLLIPLAVALGGVIELVQPSFGRGAEWADFWANNAGVAVGAILGPGVHRALLRRYGAAR